MASIAATLTPDELTTLEAALAFIDSNYGAAVDVALHGSDHGGTAMAVSAPPAFSDAVAKKRAKNVAAAARSNRKKRTELLQLRELVRALELRRDTLAAAVPRVACHATDGWTHRNECLGRTGSEGATIEALRLSEARACNRRLRAALDQQRGVGAALAQVLRKRLDLKCIQDLLTEAGVSHRVVGGSPLSTTSCNVATQLAIDRRALFLTLNANLKAFGLEANQALATAARATVLAESRTRAYRHDVIGPVVEVVSSTHVPCDVDAGWNFVMSTFCKALPSINYREFSYCAQSRPNPELGVSEKEYSMEFPDTVRAAAVPVDGVALFETFESTDWKVFIWTSMVSLRNDTTQVRERGWTAMIRAAGGPDRCVLQTHHELYSAKLATTDGSKASATPCHKTKFLAEWLLQKAKQDRSNVESALAVRFGTDAACVASLFV